MGMNYSVDLTPDAMAACGTTMTASVSTDKGRYETKVGWEEIKDE